MASTKKLWYKQPAQNWNEALPIGNGRLGGMVFGEVVAEQIQLNEDSVWYGGPRDRHNPDAIRYLPEVRKLLSEGRLKEAEKLAALAFPGLPSSQRHYEPLGDLLIDFQHNEQDYTSYRRELDLQKGLVRVQYTVGHVQYQREIFSSYPDQVMIIRLTASEKRSISFMTHFDRGKTRNLDDMEPVSLDSLVMRGITGGKEGIAFRSVIRAIAENGSVETIGNRLIATDADAVTLILSAATSYRYKSPEDHCIELINQASQKVYRELFTTHVEDYQVLFNRVDLQIEEPIVNHELATDERLELMKQGESQIGLFCTYFHFGRYLLISSSRPGSLPATLQGIWNDKMVPPWDSKFTININTEMNYWPAEVCQLSECHQPLFDHIEKMRESGQITAQKMYGCRGFVAHHNTDIWADTAPQDIYMPATVWPMGAAWLSLHLWSHYEYTGDKPFLSKAYKTLKEAALFFVDFLIETADGYLITSPSVSPENTYILPNGERGKLCQGPSMDSQIIHQLFESVIHASEILDQDKDFRDELLHMMKKLPKPKIGRYGQIQEWLEDYEEAAPGHRHISHLFALHPGNQISPRHTPNLADAAKITLERRLKHGGGHTGWSRAWIINMWARLENKEQAYANLLELLKSSTLPNLLDNHPPFQIDGNFGGIAGIAEMLLQSHMNEIHVLPSIPKEWKNGKVRGLRAKGGFELEINWNENKLKHSKIKSLNGNLCTIRTAIPVEITSGNETIKTKQLGATVYQFETEKGKEYRLTVL